VLEAYRMGVKEHGEAFMRKRFEQSAVRLLRNLFRTGLFENPYLDAEASGRTVGKPEYMRAGYGAQLQSVVMLKNKGRVLPLLKNKTVYVPKRFVPAGRNFLGMPTPEKLDYPVSLDMVRKYAKVTGNPAEADYALGFIESPNSGGGYDSEAAKAGGTGYVPISLQYGDYTARGTRDPSLAGGDPLESFTNLSYNGKTARTVNRTDLAMVTEAHAAMKGKPVIVALHLANPTVVREFEKQAGAILVHFGVQDQALLDLLTGAAEPSALLPMRMPADMQTVEAQAEDVPRDLKCYVDSEGNPYDFGYGLNWKGVIRDARTARSQRKALVVK
jgi:beta-glucosidase